jgi:hypothetical protein
MRNELIIEEGPPQDILVKYGTDTLESAFLTICCNQRTIIKVLYLDIFKYNYIIYVCVLRSYKTVDSYILVRVS